MTSEEEGKAKRTGRGPNWTADEHTALARAWIVVSQNSIKGADQRSADYQKQLLEQLCSLHPASAGRTARAVGEKMRNRETISE